MPSSISSALSLHATSISFFLWAVFALLQVGQSILFSLGAEAPGDLADGRLINLQLEHGYQAISGQAPFEDPSQFYPVPGTVAHSDMHIGTAPFYALPRGLGLSLESSFQCWILLMAAFNFAAAWLLARALGLSPLLAGPMAFAMSASAAMANFVGMHIQVLPIFPFLLALRQLVRLNEAWSWRAFCFLVGCVAWQHLCSPYLGFYATLSMLVLLPFAAPWNAWSPLFKDKHPKALGAGDWIGLALSVVAVALFLYMYSLYAAEASKGGTRSWFELKDLSPSPRSWFAPPNGSWLYADRLPAGDIANRSESGLFSGFLPWLGMVGALGVAFFAKPGGRRRALFAFSLSAALLLLYFTQFTEAGLGVNLWLAQQFDVLRTFRAAGRSVTVIHILQVAGLALLLSILARSRRLPWAKATALVIAYLAAAETVLVKQNSTRKTVLEERRNAVLAQWKAAGDAEILAFAPGYTNQSAPVVHLDAWAAALVSNRSTVNGYSGKIPGSHGRFLSNPTESRLNELLERAGLERSRVSVVTGWGEIEQDLGILKVERRPIGRLDGFALQAVEWELAHSPKRSVVDGAVYYLFHPPAQISFRVPRDHRSISYSFGLAEGAYRHGGNSDGVGIGWRLEGEEETGELYRVHWNPRDIPEHRGTSPVTIALPDGHSGLVTLEVDKGPADNGGWDWAIFSGARSE